MASAKSSAARLKRPSGEFKVALPSAEVETLSRRKAGVRALMQALSAQIQASEASGEATSFLVEVDPTGEPHVRPSAPREGDDELEAALAAARRRGQGRAAEILNGEEMLSAEAFAELLGVSRVTVNAKRQKHEVLALDGAKRGFRFPAWQVTEDGKPIAALPQLFDRLGAAWAVYRFLVQPHAALDGATGLEALRRGRTAAVLEAAESLSAGTFG